MTWKERCDRAAERGGFTDEDEDLATHWTTCAVSEHQLTEYEVKHRHAWQSTPDNLLLQQLGIQFLDAVRHNHPLHGQAVRNQYRRGCREQLVQWLDGTRATLFAPGQWEFVLKKPVWDRQAHERIYEEERIAHELARAEQDILLR